MIIMIIVIICDDYYDFWVSSIVNKGGKGIFYEYERMKKSEKVEKNNKNKK